MPTFYNFRQNGLDYSFDDIFVPADLFREGNLWTWGLNTNGQLGDNTTVQKNTPVTTFVGGANWKQVAGGSPSHTAAIKTDGTLWAWGLNSSGQLGDNTSPQRNTPVTTFTGGTNWKQVECGSNFTAAIKTDGTLWAWGDGSSNQLGNLVIPTNPFRLTPVTTFAGGTNWRQVSCGGFHTLAIKTDGTLWAWGLNTNVQLGTNDTTIGSTPVTTFAGGTNWRQVSCGYVYSAAIKSDGTLWTWGRNGQGQLGDNTVINRSTPVTTFAGGNNWKQVDCGYSHTLAIKTDGTLWIWGNNNNNQLGINDALANNRTTPVTTFAGGTNWKQVSGASSQSLATKTDGTLWTWGRNAFGTLGNNTIDFPLTPVTTFTGGSNWRQVSGGQNHTTALTYIDPVI